MGIKQNQLKLIQNFKIKHALEGTEENIVATLHLMNTHQLDKDAALDQSSFGSNDYGIDTWHFDKSSGELFIYQSKLTESKSLVIKGLKDLSRALGFLEKVIIDKLVDKIPQNNAIYNLYIELARNIDSLKKIQFILISSFNSNEIEDVPEYNETIKFIRESRLFKYFNENGGRIDLDIQEYNFEKSIAPIGKLYTIEKLNSSKINLRNKSFLEITFVPIYRLVQLYRQRGDILFHKNVRLSLYDYKDAKNRVVSSMENTLVQICKGELDPTIFPFYHVGITISATTDSSANLNEFAFETPYVINGCQTITIADRFLRDLEKRNDSEGIERFKNINVLAKIVIGTSDSELKEITNSNNRQNPIESWQLFSNDPVHMEIESSLKDHGVFYERQKGKFKSLLKRVDFAQYYPNTNNTFIEIEKLGQVIALIRGVHQWAAKPSEIFLNKQNHDLIFTSDIPRYSYDIVLCINLYKAAKRGLKNYLLKHAVHDNESTTAIFSKPIVLSYVYRTAILYHYQKTPCDYKYAQSLNKIASPALVSDFFEDIYRKFITKTKNFYLSENSKEVSSKKLNAFFNNLYIELGIDIEDGSIPFTERAATWD